MGEPDSLNLRIQECQQKCDENANCKFMIVNVVSDWCRTHSSCDTFSTPNSISVTFAKRGNFFDHVRCKIVFISKKLSNLFSLSKSFFALIIKNHSKLSMELMERWQLQC